MMAYTPVYDKYFLFLSFFTVTIARAIELKHNATIVAALSFETANFYQKAGEYLCFCGVEFLLKWAIVCFFTSRSFFLRKYVTFISHYHLHILHNRLLKVVFLSPDHTLNTLEPECSSKWRKYLQLKQHFYMAYVSSWSHPVDRKTTIMEVHSLAQSLDYTLSAGILLPRTDAAGEWQVWRGYKIPPGSRKVYVRLGIELI